MNKLLLVSLLPAAIIALSTGQAATVIVTDGAANNFGTTGGVALDFDTTLGLTADYIADLTTQLYSIDSVTLYLAPPDAGSSTNAPSPNTATVRLGVYSTLTGTSGTGGAPSTLGGFLGFSNNTVDLATVGTNNPFTFNFSGLTVTPQADPGTGTDVRYFIFQTDTAVKTELSQSTAVAIRRIDAEAGSFADELAAILQNNAGGPGGAGADVRLRTNRAPEYSATITAVPEPTALGLLGIAGVALVSRRRRQS